MAASPASVWTGSGFHQFAPIPVSAITGWADKSVQRPPPGWGDYDSPATYETYSDWVPEFGGAHTQYGFPQVMSDSNYEWSGTPDKSSFNVRVKSGDKEGTVLTYTKQGDYWVPQVTGRNYWDTNNSGNNMGLLSVLMGPLSQGALGAVGRGVSAGYNAYNAVNAARHGDWLGAIGGAAGAASNLAPTGVFGSAGPTVGNWSTGIRGATALVGGLQNDNPFAAVGGLTSLGGATGLIPGGSPWLGAGRLLGGLGGLIDNSNGRAGSIPGPGSAPAPAPAPAPGGTTPTDFSAFDKIGGQVSRQSTGSGGPAAPSTPYEPEYVGRYASLSQEADMPRPQGQGYFDAPLYQMPQRQQFTGPLAGMVPNQNYPGGAPYAAGPRGMGPSSAINQADSSANLFGWGQPATPPPTAAPPPAAPPPNVGPPDVGVPDGRWFRPELPPRVSGKTGEMFTPPWMPRVFEESAPPNTFTGSDPNGRYEGGGEMVGMPEMPLIGIPRSSFPMRRAYAHGGPVQHYDEGGFVWDEGGDYDYGDPTPPSEVWTDWGDAESLPPAGIEDFYRGVTGDDLYSMVAGTRDSPAANELRSPLASASEFGPQFRSESPYFTGASMPQVGPGGGGSRMTDGWEALGRGEFKQFLNNPAAVNSALALLGLVGSATRSNKSKGAYYMSPDQLRQATAVPGNKWYSQSAADRAQQFMDTRYNRVPIAQPSAPGGVGEVRFFQSKGGAAGSGPLGRMAAGRGVPGRSGGQADSVPAALSHGEYVMDADVVSALGDGNNAAGAAKLDGMRENIRKHKRSASPKKIPPKAKNPGDYLPQVSPKGVR